MYGDDEVNPGSVSLIRQNSDATHYTDSITKLLKRSSSYRGISDTEGRTSEATGLSSEDGYNNRHGYTRKKRSAPGYVLLSQDDFNYNYKPVYPHNYSVQNSIQSLQSKQPLFARKGQVASNFKAPPPSPGNKIDLHKLNSIFKSDGTFIENENIRRVFEQLSNERNDKLIDNILDKVVFREWFSVAIDLGALIGTQGISFKNHSANQMLTIASSLFETKIEDDYEFESDKQINKEPSQNDHNEVLFYKTPQAYNIKESDDESESMDESDKDETSSSNSSSSVINEEDLSIDDDSDSISMSNSGLEYDNKSLDSRIKNGSVSSMNTPKEFADENQLDFFMETAPLNNDATEEIHSDFSTGIEQLNNDNIPTIYEHGEYLNDANSGTVQHDDLASTSSVQENHTGHEYPSFYNDKYNLDMINQISNNYSNLDELPFIRPTVETPTIDETPTTELFYKKYSDIDVINIHLHSVLNETNQILNDIFYEIGKAEHQIDVFKEQVSNELAIKPSYTSDSTRDNDIPDGNNMDDGVSDDNSVGSVGSYLSIGGSTVNNNQNNKNGFLFSGGDHTFEQKPNMIIIDKNYIELSSILYKLEADHDIDESRTDSTGSLQLQNSYYFFNDDDGVKKIMDRAWNKVISKITNNRRRTKDSQITDFATADTADTADTAQKFANFWKVITNEMLTDGLPKGEDALVRQVLQTISNQRMDLPIQRGADIFKTSGKDPNDYKQSNFPPTFNNKPPVFLNNDGIPTDIGVLLDEANKTYIDQIAPFYDDDSIVVWYLKIDDKKTSIYQYVVQCEFGENGVKKINFTNDCIHFQDMNTDNRLFLLVGGVWEDIINDYFSTNDPARTDALKNPSTFFMGTPGSPRPPLTSYEKYKRLWYFSTELDKKVQEYEDYKFANNAEIFDPANKSPGKLIYNDILNEHLIKQNELVIKLLKDHLVIQQGQDIAKHRTKLQDILVGNRIEGGAITQDKIDGFTADDLTSGLLPNILLEAYEREAYLATINQVFGDWFTSNFKIVSCKPSPPPPQIQTDIDYRIIEFTWKIPVASTDTMGDDAPQPLQGTFQLEVNKSTVLNICVFEELVLNICIGDPLFTNTVSNITPDAKTGIITLIESKKYQLIDKNGNEALYSILLLLVNCMDFLHAHFKDLTIQELMIIFIGFIKSIGDKKQLLICSKLNKIFKENCKEGSPLGIYLSTGDRNLFAQCCAHQDAWVATIGKYASLKEVTDGNVSGGNIQKGGRDKAIKENKSLVLTYDLYTKCTTPESEEEKQRRLAAKLSADFEGVKKHIAFKLGLVADSIKLFGKNDSSESIDVSVVIESTSGATASYTELGSGRIEMYNKLFWSLKNYNARTTVHNDSNTSTVKTDARILFTSKFQQFINSELTAAQVEYITQISNNKSMPSDPTKLLSFILMNLTAETTLIEIIIYTQNKTLSELVTEYNKYIKSLQSIIDDNTKPSEQHQQTLREALSKVITYYTEIITALYGIHKEFRDGLKKKFETEMNAFEIKNQRSKRATSGPSFAQKEQQSRIEELELELQDVETTLESLRNRKSIFDRVSVQLKKVADIKKLIKKPQELKTKFLTWIDETLNQNQNTSIQESDSILSQINGIRTSLTESTTDKQILDAFNSLDPKQMKSVSKSNASKVSTELTPIAKKSAKLNDEISKIKSATPTAPITSNTYIQVLNLLRTTPTQPVDEEQSTEIKATRIETVKNTMSNMASSLKKSFIQFSTKVSPPSSVGLFGMNRRGGNPRIISTKTPNHTSRKNHNKQNNKRSNRRIRKLGVLSKKRNSNIPKSKRNQRKTIHRKSPK